MPLSHTGPAAKFATGGTLSINLLGKGYLAALLHSPPLLYACGLGGVSKLRASAPLGPPPPKLEGLTLAKVKCTGHSNPMLSRRCMMTTPTGTVVRGFLAMLVYHLDCHLYHAERSSRPRARGHSSAERRNCPRERLFVGTAVCWEL